MTQQEAKRLACRLAAVILDDGRGEAEYLHFSDELPEADLERLRAAHRELVDELWRRGTG